MDYGHEWTDDELKALEKAIADEYGVAEREMRAKLEKSMRDYERELPQAAEAMDEEGFEAWKRDWTKRNDWMRDMCEQLAAELTNAEVMAARMAGDKAMDVFAKNANYAAYEIQQGTAIQSMFQLVDRDAVKRLLSEDGDLYPQPKVRKGKSRNWNQRHIRSAVTQSILQGESIDNAAKRLISGPAAMSRATATRMARTSITGAENAGRVHTYRYDRDVLGIDVRKEWLSASDGRVRPAHRKRNGTVVGIDEEFAPGLQFPGDPHGQGAEVYNCRCTLVASLPQTRFAKKAGGKDAMEDFESKSRAQQSSKRKAKGDEVTSKTAAEALDPEDIRPFRCVAKDGAKPVTEEDYSTATVATWERAKPPKGKPDYVSGSGSTYWYTEDGVYRSSDHWGSSVATCSWYLRGENDLKAAIGAFGGSGSDWFVGTGEGRDRLLHKDAAAFCPWSGFVRKSEVANAVDEDAFSRLEHGSVQLARKLSEATEARTVTTEHGKLTPRQIVELSGSGFTPGKNKRDEEVLWYEFPNGNRAWVRPGEEDRPQSSNVKTSETVAASTPEQLAEELTDTEAIQLRYWLSLGIGDRFASADVVRAILRVRG